jgi:parallel beta-helix repeat protein
MRNQTLAALAIIIVLTAFSANVSNASLQVSATLHLSGAIFQTPTTYTYIMSVSGSNYQMKNGTTRQIIFQSTSSNQVFSNIIGNCSVGSSIDVESGLYSVNKTWTMPNVNNVTINFERNAVLVAANNLNSPVIYAVGVNNCVISGITIDGNAANQAYNAGGRYIPEDGIVIDIGSSNNLVTGANITNCGLYGFIVYGSNEIPSINNGIINSVVTFCGANCITFCLDINGYAKNNQVAYCADVGITTWGVGTVISDNHVYETNGTLGYNNASFGIAVEGGSNITITRNIVQNCGVGIDIGRNNCTVSNNTVLDSGNVGIWFLGNYNIVENNIVIGVANIVENNPSPVVQSYDLCGIYMYSATFCQINGNNVSRCTNDGIVINGNSNNNSISLNRFFDNNFGGASYGNGIAVYGNSNRISQNQCFDDRAIGSRTQQRGITIASGASNNVLIGNNVYNNLNGQISDSGSSTIIKDNTGYNPIGYIRNPISGSTILDTTGTNLYKLGISKSIVYIRRNSNCHSL